MSDVGFATSVHVMHNALFCNSKGFWQRIIFPLTYNDGSNENNLFLSVSALCLHEAYKLALCLTQVSMSKLLRLNLSD